MIKKKWKSKDLFIIASDIKNIKTEGVMIKWGTISIVLVIMLTSCNNVKSGETSSKEDLTAKEMLQGIWIDDETDMPLMRISGDTIYYVDPQNIPVYFKVLRDTIYVRGNTPIAYKIDRQTEYSFWFHSLSDEIVKLHKSENPEDTLSFSSQEAEAIPTISEVVQKDSVVMYKGTRYRGYVYINPSKMKVIRTTYSDEGIGIDNIYYDNVIHICVYEGKNLLYGQDITKKMFHTVFPEEVLSQMILTDMDFMGVNGKGYHYEATLRIPESSVYHLVDMTIDADKELHIKMVE
jgi:hypothetical protein